MAKLHRFQSGEDMDSDGEPSGKRSPSGCGSDWNLYLLDLETKEVDPS